MFWIREQDGRVLEGVTDTETMTELGFRKMTSEEINRYLIQQYYN